MTSLVAIIGWGLYGFYLEYVYGLGLGGDRLPVAWGLNVVDFVYFIAISMAGTIISGILRLSKTTWRIPITRIAETITVAALPIGALFPMLDLGMPQRAFNLLIFARLQSPIAWDSVAISTYLLASWLYFYMPLIPDLALCRDSLKKISKLRGWLYTMASLGWSDAVEQQKRLNRSIKIMAILIVPLAVTVHSVLSWVFSVTLRVEWHSTIFPIFFVMGAVYSGLATILIVVYAFRRVYHLERYIEVKHILYLAYIFLAANLAMIYLTLSEYMAPAWASETLDTQYLTSIFTGAYAPYFWFMLVGGLLLPALIVSLPRTRTVGWIVVAAILANAGMWLERLSDSGSGFSCSTARGAICSWELYSFLGGALDYSCGVCGLCSAVDRVEQVSANGLSLGAQRRLRKERMSVQHRLSQSCRQLATLKRLNQQKGGDS